MGKNKKKLKNTSTWNMSLEDQERLADMLYDLERGKDTGGSVLDMMNIKTPSRTMGVESDVLLEKTRELLANNPDSYGNVTEDDGINYTDYVNGNASKPNGREVTLATVKKEKGREETVTVKNDSKRNGVYVNLSNISNIFRRLSIEDGVTSTPIYLPALHNFKVDLSDMPKDDVIETIDLLINHIVLLSHPMAIITDEEYAEIGLISKIKNYDTNKFRFFFFTPSVEEEEEETTYVSCYYVDYASFIKLAEFMKEIPLENLFAVYIMIARVCSSVSRVFLMEDSTYVKVFEQSSYNQKEQFLSLLANDEGTELSEEDVADEIIFSRVRDAFGTRNDMFDWLDDNVEDEKYGSDIFDDEDDDDGEEELEGESLMKHAIKEDDKVEETGPSSIEKFFDENPEKLAELDEISGYASNSNEALVKAEERYHQVQQKVSQGNDTPVTPVVTKIDKIDPSEDKNNTEGDMIVPVRHKKGGNGK